MVDREAQASRAVLLEKLAKKRRTKPNHTTVLASADIQSRHR